MSSAVQGIVNQWAAAHGLQIGSPGSAGNLSVTIDRVRVHLVTSRSSEIVVEARVRDLPAAPDEQNRLLRRALELSTARMTASAAGPSVDPAGSTLKLQTRVSANATIEEFDRAVSMIVGEVELWRELL